MTMFRWRPPIRVINRLNPERNGRNGVLGVTMYGNPGSDAGSLAQEMGERDWKWSHLYWPAIGAGAIGAVAVLLALAWSWSTAGYAVAAGVLPMGLALAVQRLPRIRRRIELWGHEVEVQGRALIYGRDVAELRWRAAGELRAGYGGIFNFVMLVTVADAMADHAPAAGRYVRRVLPVLREFRARWR